MMNAKTIKAERAQLQVKYVSLPPGAGKTTAAIEMMRQHLTGELTLSHQPKYIFYVAATVELLKQTANNLRKVVKDKDQQAKIRIAYFDKTDPVTVQQQVPNILNGLTNDGSGKWPFKRGSVLFITHEAFLMLSQAYRIMYSNTLVLFDEARKWADMVSPIIMDDGTQEFFDKLFHVQPMALDAKVKGISEILAKNFPENQKVQALQGCGKKAARAFKALDELHRALNVPSDAPTRMRVYAFFEKSKSATKLIQVKLPSFPFIGFLDVFILSADFTTSQMYCFFKDEGTRVLNKSQWFMDTFHVDGYKKCIQRAIRRYEYVDIVALNTDQTPPAIGKYRIGGLMVPRPKLVELGELMESWEMSGTEVLRSINRVRNPMKNPPADVDKGIVKILAGMGAKTDMLKWFVEASHKVVKAWRKKNPSDKPALMFLNNEFQNVMKVDGKLFQQLNHAETVGDNRWYESNVVVFLAAINPEPHMSRLLKARLGHLGYDPQEDFIVDKVIQATGRGNIRTPGIKERMLIVVPTEGLAQKVAERLEERPTYHANVVEKLGNFVSWNPNLFASLSLQVANPERPVQVRKLKRTKRQLTKIEKLKERALYQAAYHAKKRGDMELYNKLETERDALRFIPTKESK